MNRRRVGPTTLQGAQTQQQVPKENGFAEHEPVSAVMEQTLGNHPPATTEPAQTVPQPGQVTLLTPSMQTATVPPPDPPQIELASLVQLKFVQVPSVSIELSSEAAIGPSEPQKLQSGAEPSIRMALLTEATPAEVALSQKATGSLTSIVPCWTD